MKCNTSVSVNTDIPSDLSKSVIEQSCACKDTCNTCPSKLSNSCGSQNDLSKFCAKDTVKLCSCVCNKDRNHPVSLDKQLSEQGLDGVEDEHPKETAARSLFSVVAETGKCTIPSDSSDMKCVLTQNESPKVRSDEATPALCTSRTFAGPDLSAIVDGENAMFPDIIGNGCQESQTENLVSDNELDSKVEKEPNRQSKEIPVELVSDEVDEKLNSDRNDANIMSSQAEYEKAFKGMLDNGWGVKEGDNLTLAELYLMFGEDGELKFEYEWVSLRREAEMLQEKLLINLNNMLRRLSHLAMIEFTDFTKVICIILPVNISFLILNSLHLKT